MYLFTLFRLVVLLKQVFVKCVCDNGSFVVTDPDFREDMVNVSTEMEIRFGDAPIPQFM